MISSPRRLTLGSYTCLRGNWNPYEDTYLVLSVEQCQPFQFAIHANWAMMI